MTCSYLKCISIIGLGCILASCSKDPEYTSLPFGAKYKLLAFDEQNFRLDSAAMVYLDLAVLHHPEGDTLGRFPNMAFIPNESPFWQFVRKRYVNDSLLYITSANSDLIDANTDSLRYHFRILRLRSFASMRDARMLELYRLDSLVNRDSVSGRFVEYKGLWFRSLNPGDTSLVREGHEVVVNYSGRDLNGKVLDDSRTGYGPLRFTYGNENQVIKGLEIALERMHRGERAEVIIPSWLAFGARGSGGGVVPPYTTLVYTLEVAELSRY